MLGITPGGEDDAAGALLRELHLDLTELFLGDGPHDREEVTFQERKNNLGLRISEAAVVFDDLRTVFGNHQSKIQAAFKGTPFRVHCTDRR